MVYFDLKTNVDKFKRIGKIQSMFTDNKTIKLKDNNRKKYGKQSEKAKEENPSVFLE